MKEKCVLAFMAHPDDVEFQCSGTLMRLKDLGWELHIATMTGGDGGTVEYTPEEIQRIRFAEGTAAADLIGASYRCAGEFDFLVSYEQAAIRKTVEIVRETQPSLVITHSPVDYMRDHEVTSQLVRNACFCAGAPNMQTDVVPPASPLTGIPHLYYASPMESKDFFGEPVVMPFYVDITATIEQKEAMLKCHASQRDWLMKHHGMDEYLETMRRSSSEAGEHIGVTYAEGFRQHLGHAYPQDNLLGEMLGGATAG